MARSEPIRKLGRSIRNRLLRSVKEEREARPLWNGLAPGAIGEAAEDVPTFSLYLPEGGPRGSTAIVVFPGGGYSGHAEHEAAPVGQWLRRTGIPAMVVRYRLAPRYHHPAMLQDARRAVRVMREEAAPLGITRVGVLGFSAGGHLAGMAALLHDDAPEVAEKPDFAVLIYPVVCMVGPLSHPGCRGALLGTTDENLLAARLSLERCVGAEAPPLFIVHGANDEVIDVGNSLALAASYRQSGASCELHVFADGRHGFGLGERERPNAAWPDLCLRWLRSLP